MNTDLEYKKGWRGHVRDYRAALGRVHEVTGQMCKALDVGDMAAMAVLAAIYTEALNDCADAMNAADKAMP